MITEEDIERSSGAETLDGMETEPAEGRPFRFSWPNFICAMAFTLAMCILFCGGIA